MINASPLNSGIRKVFEGLRSRIQVRGYPETPTLLTPLWAIQAHAIGFLSPLHCSLPHRTPMRVRGGFRIDTDFNAFLAAVERDADKHGVKLIAKRKKLLQTILAERNEGAREVIARIHKPAKVEAAPLHGLFAATIDGRPAVVEYEPDPDLCDTEQVPLLDEGGIEAFLRREVLPYAPDAWYGPGQRQDRLRDQLHPLLL